MRTVWKDSPEWDTLGIDHERVFEEACTFNIVEITDDLNWLETPQGDLVWWGEGKPGTWLIILSNWSEDHSPWASGYTCAKVFDDREEWDREVKRFEDIPQTLSHDGHFEDNKDHLYGIGRAIRESAE